MPVSLRFATVDDAPAIAAIYGPHVAGEATSFELVPPDAPEMARRITSLLETYPWLVAEALGMVTGYAYASPHRPRPGYRWSVEVSVYVDAGHHRGRVGRALYTALFEILALQRFVNAYAGITLPNPASVGFHEAMGFKPVGTYRQIGYKFGTWHDVAWYARELAAHIADPPEPIPLSRLRQEGHLPEYLRRPDGSF